MRLLHVDHSPVYGGAERSHLELARSQRERSHDVLVAVGRPGDFSAALTRAGIPWRDLKWPSRYLEASSSTGLAGAITAVTDLIRARRSLRRLVEEVRPHVVQVHTRKAQVVAAFSALSSRSKVIFHLREAPPEESGLRSLVAAAVRRADHAVALSRWIAGAYKRAGAVPRSHEIGCVASGVDGTQLAQLETPWLDGRRAPVVGYIGHIAKRKAPHLLVEAAEKLDDPRVTFRVVGSVWFPAAEAAYGTWFESRLASSPAWERVIRAAAVADPIDAFREIDVLVHTSVLPEAFGRVVVEAMAAQRPVIAFDLGPMPELIDDTTGVLLRETTSDAIVEGLRVLLSDRNRARDLARAAQQRAALFTPQNVAAAMDDEYARLGIAG